MAADDRLPADPTAWDLPLRFLLMATRDRTGRPLGFHPYGFGAAVLAEMALRGHVRLEGKRVVPAYDAPDDVRYATVWHDARGRRPRGAAWWVARLSGGRYRLLRHQFTQQLVQAGVVEEARTWWGGTAYPSQGTGAEQTLRRAVRSAVQQRDASDDRTVCLVAILVAADSDKELDPDRRVRKAIRRQAKQWIKEDAFARSVQELVTAVVAGIAAAGAVAASAGS